MGRRTPRPVRAEPIRVVSDGRSTVLSARACLRSESAGCVFEGATADRLRTAIARACTASGVPAFSPHDLRHRRATLWHLGGIPAAQASSWLGHSAQEHLRTYAHRIERRPIRDSNPCRRRERAVS